jgi:hypothetical protein
MSSGKISILDQFKNLKPEGGLPIFKFKDEGDAIAAKLIERWVGVQTKMGRGNALDIDILENANGSELGPHTIFELRHITEIFDKHAPEPGDVFYLRFDSIDKNTGKKRFAFKITERGAAKSPMNGDDIPF